MGRSIVRVVHITDTHIPGKAGSEVYGVDSFEALRTLISVIQEDCAKTDVLIATGDLSQDGTEASYRRLRSLLGPLGRPTYCIAGNHDVFPAMRLYLRGEGVQIERRAILGQWQIVFLDSHVPGEMHGYLSDEELGELDDALGKMPKHHSLVCLHHGPVAVCSMPACHLSNANELMAVLRRHPNVRAHIRS
jgi:Icc protein